MYVYIYIYIHLYFTIYIYILNSRASQQLKQRPAQASGSASRTMRHQAHWTLTRAQNRLTSKQSSTPYWKKNPALLTRTWLKQPWRHRIDEGPGVPCLPSQAGQSAGDQELDVSHPEDLFADSDEVEWITAPQGVQEEQMAEDEAKAEDKVRAKRAKKEN